MIGSSTVRSGPRPRSPTPAARSAASIAGVVDGHAHHRSPSAARNRAAIVATHSSSASFSAM